MLLLQVLLLSLYPRKFHQLVILGCRLRLWLRLVLWYEVLNVIIFDSFATDRYELLYLRVYVAGAHRGSWSNHLFWVLKLTTDVSLCDEVVCWVFWAKDLSMKYILTTVHFGTSMRIFNILVTYVLLGEGKLVIRWHFLVLEKTYAHQITVQILIQKAILIWQVAFKFWCDIDFKLTCALPHYLMLA